MLAFQTFDHPRQNHGQNHQVTSRTASNTQYHPHNPHNPPFLGFTHNPHQTSSAIFAKGGTNGGAGGLLSNKKTNDVDIFLPF
jgi:hypothetical protein